MKRFLKDHGSYLVLGATVFFVVAVLGEHYNRPRTYAAVCSGQQYKFVAPSYRLGSGGCVTFKGVGFVCGCNLVVEVKEEAKK
jgi:hypothetical protein